MSRCCLGISSTCDSTFLSGTACLDLYVQIKKFLRAFGKDVGAMGGDMQALKKNLDDVRGAGKALHASHSPAALAVLRALCD
jgi:hypothetical protein